MPEEYYDPEICGERCQKVHELTDMPIAEHQRILSDIGIIPDDEIIHRRGLNKEYCSKCEVREKQS